MKKVIVIGCPGSGKSTFSRMLHNMTGIPLFHLDQMFWNADRTTVEKSLFYARLMEAMQSKEWILDGNYASTLELRMQKCDTVFFLDYPTDICLSGIHARQGVPRSDMPWIETGEYDAEFLDFITNYRSSTRPQVMELLERYSCKDIFIFSNRTEADAFFDNIQAEPV